MRARQPTSGCHLEQPETAVRKSDRLTARPDLRQSQLAAGLGASPGGGADPDVVEEFKWKKPSRPAGVPVWSHDGMICTGETYRNHLKVTSAKGAKIDDPAGLFNASLEGNARRAIDVREGDKLDAKAFKTRVRAAVILNRPGGLTRPCLLTKPPLARSLRNKKIPTARAIPLRLR